MAGRQRYQFIIVEGSCRCLPLARTAGESIRPSYSRCSYNGALEGLTDSRCGPISARIRASGDRAGPVFAPRFGNGLLLWPFDGEVSTGSCSVFVPSRHAWFDRL
jgi:hypothetical protein